MNFPLTKFHKGAYHCIRILDLRLHLDRHINDSSDYALADTEVGSKFRMFLRSEEEIFSIFSLLFRNWFVRWITGTSGHPSDHDEDDDDKDKEEKKTFEERLQVIQEVSQTVQTSIGYQTSLGESVKK